MCSDSSAAKCDGQEAHLKACHWFEMSFCPSVTLSAARGRGAKLAMDYVKCVNDSSICPIYAVADLGQQGKAAAGGGVSGGLAQFLGREDGAFGKSSLGSAPPLAPPSPQQLDHKGSEGAGR